MIVKRDSWIVKLCWHLPWIRIEDVRVGKDTTSFRRIFL